MELGAERLFGFQASDPFQEEPIQPNSDARALLASDSRIAEQLCYLNRLIVTEESLNRPEHTHLFLRLHQSEIGGDLLIESLESLAEILAGRHQLVVTVPAGTVGLTSYFTEIRKRLSEIDAKVAYDHFEASSAQLSQWACDPPDFVKLAPSMTMGIGQDRQRRRSLTSLIDTGAELHIKLIATGLRYEPDVQACRQLGCRLGEGPVFGSFPVHCAFTKTDFAQPPLELVHTGWTGRAASPLLLSLIAQPRLVDWPHCVSTLAAHSRFHRWIHAHRAYRSGGLWRSLEGRSSGRFGQGRQTRFTVTWTTSGLLANGRLWLASRKPAIPSCFPWNGSRLSTANWVVVTELADKSLKDRFDECRNEGLSGIPRDELLVYMGDAADALDYMRVSHGLQHLDVKPENLLITSGRVKVADFGLVKSLQDDERSLLAGLTPQYAPPELFDGSPSTASDQYSLAIVYQEMLTGIPPFPGRTAAPTCFPAPPQPASFDGPGSPRSKRPGAGSGKGTGPTLRLLPRSGRCPSRRRGPRPYHNSCRCLS